MHVHQQFNLVLFEVFDVVLELFNLTKHYVLVVIFYESLHDCREGLRGGVAASKHETFDVVYQLLVGKEGAVQVFSVQGQSEEIRALVELGGILFELVPGELD